MDVRRRTHHRNIRGKIDDALPSNATPSSSPEKTIDSTASHAGPSSSAENPIEPTTSHEGPLSSAKLDAETMEPVEAMVSMIHINICAPVEIGGNGPRVEYLMFPISIKADDTLEKICGKIAKEFHNKMEYTWRPTQPDFWPSLPCHDIIWWFLGVQMEIYDVQVKKACLCFVFIREKRLLTRVSSSSASVKRKKKPHLGL